jgi:hypothetical protein
MCLMAYMEAHKDPLIIQLKPMRELLQVWQDIPEVLRQKTTLAQYGSFNYRSIMDKADAEGSHARIQAMIDGFGHVLIYESFLATGAQNSISSDTMPTLFASIHATVRTSPFLACMMRLVSIWNTHCLERCQKTLAWFDSKPQPLSDQDVAARHRSAKIVEGITKSIDSQMVLADSGLALVLENSAFEACHVPVDVSFDIATGYTQTIDRADATSAIYRNVPYESLDIAFTQVMQQA